MSMHAATLLGPHAICPLNLLPIIHEVHARAGDFPECVTLTIKDDCRREETI